MKFEDQVCSLELAKRLKELGVKQESFFYYGRVEDTCFKETHHEVIIHRALWEWNEDCFYYTDYSAFSVAELGEMLPIHIEQDNYCHEILMCVSDEEYKTNDYEEYILVKPRTYQIGYNPLSGENDTPNEKFFHEDKKEADVRAKALIYLLENGLIKPD